MNEDNINPGPGNELTTAFISDYTSGLTLQQIADKNQVPLGFVRRILMENGIEKYNQYKLKHKLRKQRSVINTANYLLLKPLFKSHLDAGMLVEEIGRKYGCSDRIVNRILKESKSIDSNESVKNPETTSKELSTFISEYTSGLTLKEIAALHKVSISYARTKLIGKDLRIYYGYKALHGLAKRRKIFPGRLKPLFNAHLSEGLSVSDISQKYNCKIELVNQVLAQGEEISEHKLFGEDAEKIKLAKARMEQMIADRESRRAKFVKYYTEGMPIKEIAAKHGISDERVRQIISEGDAEEFIRLRKKK